MQLGTSATPRSSRTTTGRPFSTYAARLNVVPRSMPTTCGVVMWCERRAKATRIPRYFRRANLHCKATAGRPESTRNASARTVGGSEVNEEQALLTAIVAQPDEDTPRLVYADWIEEHGQPERAEFIRLQIQEANLADGAPEREKVAERRRALEKAHEDEWVADLPAAVARRAKFERGFVTKLDTSAAAIARVPKRVWARHPIRELILNEMNGKL